MKLLLLLSLFAVACQKSEEIRPDSDETIQRQEEYEGNDLREEEQIPVDSTDEMEYYRDVINEGELDN